MGLQIDVKQYKYTCKRCGGVFHQPARPGDHLPKSCKCRYKCGGRMYLEGMPTREYQTKFRKGSR